MTQDEFDFTTPREPKKLPDSPFNGPEYKPSRDHSRLKSQLNQIFNLMKDRQWRTLPRIAELTGAPEPSVSAQLRHLRKPKFGTHTVNRRHISNGLFEYQVIPNDEYE
jgi:hypothetical protein